MRVTITGHRPEDLENIEWVQEKLTNTILQLNPEQVYIGMAAGVDLLAGKICVENNIPIIACKPWAGHKPRYSDILTYNNILRAAQKITILNPSQEYPGAWVYMQRNYYMVDQADLTIAVWSGKKTGGTAACVQYAKKKPQPIIQLNPQTKTKTMINSTHGLF